MGLLSIHVLPPHGPLHANPWKDSIASSLPAERVDQDGHWLVAAGVGETCCTMSEWDDDEKEGEDVV